MYRISFIYSYYGLDMAHFEEDFQKGDHCLNNMRMYYIDRSRNRKNAKQSAIFVARKSHSSYRTLLNPCLKVIKVCDLTNSVVKNNQTHRANKWDFCGGTASLILSSVVRDFQQQETVAEMNPPPLKYVVWSADGSLVALMSKHSQSNCLVFPPFSYFL